MTVSTYPAADAGRPTNNVVNASANRAGAESTSMKSEHRVGNTVDKVDQVSSVTLLGIAIVGAVAMLALHWLVG
ncbi:hypothetical protein [Methylobacterium sp. J-090]|uniref:hypothetical protein n=1 Tax=Methylobacterium sp. J-090 TaxID=2836666 RepID=UPI001FB9146E|nr:hypothetical protein [Methylobacterium sp. J-090]MCJ2082767.1 hypothetical protein [Methylobacterium sp. J-090]